MLFRVGKFGYILIFAVVVFVWSTTHGRPTEVLHKGWQTTTQSLTFGQGASFANDEVAAVDLRPIVVEEPSPYAYVFYATRDTYACSILINIRQLVEVHNTKHRIFVLLTETVSVSYIEAFGRFNATVSIQKPPPLAVGTDGAGYYSDCLLKLHAFKMHHVDPTLKRVIVMDSDQLVLKNFDYLFEEYIDADLAAPRAYWIAEETISTAFMLITLSERVWESVDYAIGNVGVNKYDMDIVNDLFRDTVMLLPGSFVTLNSHWEDWNLPLWFRETKGGGYGNVTIEKTTKLLEPEHLGKRWEKRYGSADKDAATANRYLSPATDEAATRDTHHPAPARPTAEETKEKEKEHHSGKTNPMPLIPPTPPDPLPKSPNSIPNPNIPTSKHQHDKPHYLNGVIKLTPSQIEHLANGGTLEWDEEEPPSPITPPEERRIYAELFELYGQTAVLHFTALGKPWSVNDASVSRDRPAAHPVFGEQFLVWRRAAVGVCPGGIVDFV